MKLLVTGGCGFIGCNFVRDHLREFPGDTVVNLDALTYAGNPENLADVEDNRNYRFVKGDVADFDLVEKLFADEKFDAVVHFAAESHVDRSIENPQVFLRTNVLGTQSLLLAAHKHGVKRYVQISTDEVYGTLGPEGEFFETTPLAPRSPYSASKASADLLVMSYFTTYNLPVLITRCSNNYGPYQFPEKVLPLMTINALADKELPVYGDGLQRREWLHVSDHCSAIELVLQKGVPGQVYNVGGVNEKTNMEVITRLLEILGKPASLIKHVKDRPGHDRRYAINADKIQRELGWKARVGFEEGLEETIRWYLDNRAWWEKIVSGEYRQYYERMYGGR
ncbi:MAG: dTDP-glucose 4,6-dehydratase [Candidatus Sumerlaeaceae bacterium]|nr:dTDP-glucose 4,6-dehydratase [Candidatus Sumerlaeaceae bacterium]